MCVSTTRIERIFRVFLVGTQAGRFVEGYARAYRKSLRKELTYHRPLLINTVHTALRNFLCAATHKRAVCAGGTRLVGSTQFRNHIQSEWIATIHNDSEM